jgi:hypothetical protein
MRTFRTRTPFQELRWRSWPTGPYAGSHQQPESPSSWANDERAVLDGRLKLADSLTIEEGDSIRNRARAWYSNFERHGRFYLGFHAYVARHTDA